MTFSQQSILLAAAPWRFETPSVLLLLIALPFVAALLWLAFLRRRNALKMFEGMTPQESRPTSPRAGAKIALITIGFAMLTIAAARPQADPIEENVTVRGRDIVFLVDVSKSMLSRDAVPSRLGRAKLWINDLVNTLKGDRVGLVAFAGVPVVKSPLTLDLGYFRMALDELSPASVPRGGTLIGDAIRKTLSDVFEPGEGRYRDIVLITDGEDLGSFPTEAAKKAAEMGVRIIVIGIGSELEGALVPEEEENSQRYIERDGKKVRSKMDGSTLAAIAEAATQAGAANGGGVFLNVGTGTMDLDKVYHDLIASAEQRETESKANVTYRELFPYFLGLAALCFGIEPLIAGRRRIRRASGQARVPGAALTATVLFLAFSNPHMARSAQSGAASPAAAASPAPQTKGEANPAPPPPPTPPPSPDALYNSGRDLFLAGKYAEAADQFRQSDLGASDPDLAARARFNLGQSLLKQATASPQAGAQPDPAQSIAQLDAAARAFRSALAAKPDDAEAARNVEIARTLMQQKQQEEEKKKQEQEQKDKSKQDQSKQDQTKQDQNEQKKDGQDKSGDKSQSNDQNSQGSDSKQHQDNADKLKDLAQKQKDAADKSKDASESKEPSENSEKQQQAKDAQQNVDQRTQEEQQKQKESGKPSNQETQDKLDSARKEQQAASEALDEGDTKKAEEHQRKAAEQLDQAAQSEQKAADEAKKQEQAKEDQAKKDQQGKQAEAKEEKAKYNETASQLLDRERKQRDARQQLLRALRGKPQPVEKDW